MHTEETHFTMTRELENMQGHRYNINADIKMHSTHTACHLACGGCFYLELTAMYF